MKPLAAALSIILTGITYGCAQPAVNPPAATRVQQEPYQRDRSEPRTNSRDTGRHNRAQQDAAPGAFDYYLLTLSWSPEFCVSHASAAECSAHPAFILHGLWPENSDGTYPENCSNAPGPKNPSAYKDIYPDQSLLAHEWKTHGTCSGLTPDKFFTSARQALHAVAIPPALSRLKTQISLTPQQILGDFATVNPSYPTGSFAMACGNNRLTAVEVCVDKSLHAVACQNLKTCRANTVKITPPGATSD